jgi:hypothetical protein
MNVIAMALIVVDAKYGNPLAFRAVLSPTTEPVLSVTA